MTLAEKARDVPILDLATRMGFNVKRVGSKYYTLKEHDSVIIDEQKNCFWRNSMCSTGSKGHKGSPIDFVMEFEGYYQAKEAIHFIANMYGFSSDSTDYKYEKRKSITNNSTTTEKKAHGDIVFPEKALSNDRVISYLCEQRHIDSSIVKTFIDKQLLYQDKRNNCVFVAPNKKFGCLRSTGAKRFVRDLDGCDYEQCFLYYDCEKPTTIIVTESVIDAMSVMSYGLHNKNFLPYNSNRAYLALSGTNKISSLYYHLKLMPDVNAVFLAVDRDEAGQKALTTVITHLGEIGFKGTIRLLFPPKGKDWNEAISPE